MTHGLRRTEGRVVEAEAHFTSPSTAWVRGARQSVGPLYTEKYFWNLIKSNRYQIIFTIFWLIWNQTDVRCVPNQSENGKYNLISVSFNKIFLCVRRTTFFYQSSPEMLTPIGMMEPDWKTHKNPLVDYCTDIRGVSGSP